MCILTSRLQIYISNSLDSSQASYCTREDSTVSCIEARNLMYDLLIEEYILVVDYAPNFWPLQCSLLLLE